MKTIASALTVGILFLFSSPMAAETKTNNHPSCGQANAALTSAAYIKGDDGQDEIHGSVVNCHNESIYNVMVGVEFENGLKARGFARPYELKPNQEGQFVIRFDSELREYERTYTIQWAQGQEVLPPE